MNDIKTKKDALIVAVASGKGGVGKTVSSINIANSAVHNGKRVLLIDGDFGLANIDVVLGLQSRHNINDMVEQDLSIEDIILEGPFGIHIVPSASGISHLANLSLAHKVKLAEELDKIKQKYDLIVIDAGAGIADNVIQLCNIAHEIVVVTTPEPHAITDAYALVKVLTTQNHNDKINILVNQVLSTEQGANIFSRLSDVSRKFLGVELNHVSSIPTDDSVKSGINCQRLLNESSIYSKSGHYYKEAYFNLVDNSSNRDRADWRELINIPNAQRINMSQGEV